MDKDIKFELRLAEVRFPERPTNRFLVGVGLTKTVLHLTACLVDTGEGVSLMNLDYWICHWICGMRGLESPTFTVISRLLA